MNRNRPLLMIAVLATSLFCIAAVFDNGKLYPIAPSQIPHVEREMKTAGFWIGRLAKPDAILMDAKAIKAFNTHVRETLRLTKDIRKVPNPYDGRALREELLSRLNDLKGKNYFTDDGTQTDEAFFERMAGQMALEAIEDAVPLEYGFIVRYADQRFLPTDEGLYAIARDIDFDELQNSALDMTTPVVILHRSADKKWMYVLSELSDGWVHASKAAVSEWPDFEEYLAMPFAVITAPTADLYLDETLTQFYDHVRMGVKIPATDAGRADVLAVALPTVTDSGKNRIQIAFVDKEQISTGFLPYTPRAVIEQAFKMLNEPYGWGGMYGGQDCSRLLQEVFATVGIDLPRDSKDQARTGKGLAAFKEDEPLSNKIAALKNAPVGNVILPMKGHIVLYLGTVNDRPYAIHSLWGYREPSDEGDVVRVINRTAVSDLYLGEGSGKGSLLKRLSAIRSISNDK